MSSSFCISEESFSGSFNRRSVLPSSILEDLGEADVCSPEEDSLPLDCKRFSHLIVVEDNDDKKKTAEEGTSTSRESSSKSTRSQQLLSTTPSTLTSNSPSSPSTTTTSTNTACMTVTASHPIMNQPNPAVTRPEHGNLKRDSTSSHPRQRSADRSSSLSGSSSSSSAMKLKALKANVEPGASIFSGNKANSKNAVLCRRLDECAHFHYEVVELKSIELSLVEDNFDDDFQDKWLVMEVSSRDRQWKVRRSYHSLHQMDKQLHDCIFKRKFSMLPELAENLVEDEGHIRARGKVCTYFDRLTTLPVSRINCGPVLCWMEMDNRGNRVILPDSDSAINIPAVAAAHSIKPYTAQSVDELSLKIGDILSIIDKPPSNESSWWRGKKELEVGFFPSECVELLDSERLPQSIASRCVVNTHLKHSSSIGRRNKLKSLLMSFFSNRPNRSSLRRSGIVKERLFACDLGEHLLNSDEEVPAILKCCAEVLEVHGIVDGIYRLSGAASTINKLRNEFDEGRTPELTSEAYIQDIHSISSLLKMYFRELPNPLLTYELYDKFIEAITGKDEEIRLSKICDVIRQLPPPHYRTAEYLFKHLNKMASHDDVTSMHCKNLAIVWAPNLLRSKELEQMKCGTAALRGVGIQAVVTEYLIKNVSLIFNEESQICEDGVTTVDLSKLRSVMPTAQKLLTLEEAQERKSQLVSTHLRQKNFIEVGGGSAGLPIKYHTVINLKDKKKLREKINSPSRLKTLFRRSQSTSFKENQGSEGTKCGSAREKKTSSAGAETPHNPRNTPRNRSHPPTIDPPTNNSNNKRNLSTSALLSNGTPAGDACFGILDDFKRLSTSCEIPAEPSSKQNKNGGKKIKSKHRSTSVDVASSELSTLLISLQDTENSNFVDKTTEAHRQPQEKTSKKKASARQSPTPVDAATKWETKGKKNKKPKPQQMDNTKEDEGKAKERITTDYFVAVELKECSLPNDEETFLDKPIVASDESDFRSDSLEAFEFLYADGLHLCKEDVVASSKQLNSNRISGKSLKPTSEGDENNWSVLERNPKIDVKEINSNVVDQPCNQTKAKSNNEVIVQSSSNNDLLDWSLSSDITSKDLYKELSPTLNNIWMESGCYGIKRGQGSKAMGGSHGETKNESLATSPSLSSSLSAVSSNFTPDISKCNIPSADSQVSETRKSHDTENKHAGDDDSTRKMDDLHFALNILEQSCDVKPEPLRGFDDVPVITATNLERNIDEDDDDPVFSLIGAVNKIVDKKDADKITIDYSNSGILPQTRQVIKSTSSVPSPNEFPATESLSDAALDLFSFNRMYSNENLSHAKLQVSNEDGYVYARGLHGKPLNESVLSFLSKDTTLTSAPVMTLKDEHELLRKLASYGSSGGVNDRTVMMPVGNAAKKFDSEQKILSRNTVPSTCLFGKVEEALQSQAKDVCSPSASSHSFPQASTDPLRRKDNILSSPASSVGKESHHDKMEFLFRTNGEKNTAFRNHHRHSTRHFHTPSPEIFHSSITPPQLQTAQSDSFGTSSIRVTNREVKMWQDQSHVAAPNRLIEQKASKHLANDIRNYNPSVIILNRPSSILRNETQLSTTSKSQVRHTTQFSTKPHEHTSFKSPVQTHSQFSWSQNSSSNFDSGRKSLPASHYSRSYSLEENGEVNSTFKKCIKSYQQAQAMQNLGMKPFSQTETQHREYSAISYSHKDMLYGVASCFNTSIQKSSQTTFTSPPTPRTNQTFVLDKKQIFENHSKC